MTEDRGETLGHWLAHLPEQGGVWIGDTYIFVAYDSRITVYEHRVTGGYIWQGWGSDFPVADVGYVTADDHGYSYPGFW